MLRSGGPRLPGEAPALEQCIDLVVVARHELRHQQREELCVLKGAVRAAAPSREEPLHKRIHSAPLASPGSLRDCDGIYDAAEWSVGLPASDSSARPCFKITFQCKFPFPRRSHGTRLITRLLSAVPRALKRS